MCELESRVCGNNFGDIGTSTVKHPICQVHLWRSVLRKGTSVMVNIKLAGYQGLLGDAR
jgi:hypothetical protein